MTTKPKNPGDLFIWRQPFQPVVRLAPLDAARRTSSGAPTAPKRHNVVFLGFNLLGDFLCTTPVIRAYRQRHPEAFITYVVQNAGYCHLLDGNPDIDLVIYSDELYMFGEQILTEDWIRSLPIGVNEGCELYRLNIHEVVRSDPNVFEDNIACGYSRFLGIPIDSVRPVVVTTPAERALARSLVRGRYIIFGLHSVSKVIGDDGELAAKNWILERWIRLAKELHALLDCEIIAVGSEKDQSIPTRWFRSLHGLPVKIVAALVEGAACVVTVEGGLSHLCHAVDAPMVVIFSKFVRFHWAFPREARHCRIIYEDPRLISTHEVATSVKMMLSETGAL